MPKKPALIIVDMTKDNLTGIFEKQGDKIIPKINELSQKFREKNLPVIFANDSFFREDFLFKSKMPPHSLRFTEGSEVTEKLIQEKGDIILPKRRFSAFFKTDLDQTLRTYNIDTVCVCGITTLYCVLATAFDAICHDFYAFIIEDAVTAHSDEAHTEFLNFYRKNPLQPLFEIKKSTEIMEFINE